METRGWRLSDRRFQDRMSLKADRGKPVASVTGLFGGQRQAADVTDQVVDLVFIQNAFPCRHEGR